MYPVIRCRTHVAQARVNDAMHLCDSPLDYVAKALVIDKKVLPAHRTLCSFFEFILTMARENGSVGLWPKAALAVSGVKKVKAHACISPSFSRVAMSLLSSLTCSPTLPAKSSSLRLRDRDK